MNLSSTALVPVSKADPTLPLEIPLIHQEVTHELPKTELEAKKDSKKKKKNNERSTDEKTKRPKHYNDRHPKHNTFNESLVQHESQITQDDIRPKSKKRVEVTEEKALEFIHSMIDRMNTAVDEDIKAIESKQVGLAKFTLLDEALHEIAKPKWKFWFLREGICQVFSRWLTPVEASIPNLTIRSRILHLLRNLPISAVHLQGTDLGIRLISLWKSPEETEENRAAIRDIVQCVLRPVFGLNTNHRIREFNSDDFLATASQAKQPELTSSQSSNPITMNTRRARIPLQAAHTFKVMPKSAVILRNSQEHVDTNIGRLHRLTSINKKNTSTSRRVSRVVLPSF